MTEDEDSLDYRDNFPLPDDGDTGKYAAPAKLRRIRLLEDQLDDVKEDLKNRVGIHKNLEKKFQRGTSRGASPKFYLITT